MQKSMIFGLLASALAACQQGAINENFMADVAGVDPDGPPVEVIYKRFAPIKPAQVEVHIGYSFDCKNLQDVGVLTGWGKKEQTQGEIFTDFQTRAAKYGANLVVYEAGVSSVAELDELLHRRTEYTLMRCP